MARLNVETKITSDLRFQELLIRVGDRQKAKGMLWELWELAQSCWFPSRQAISEAAWERSGLTQALVECGFAEKRDGGYYAKGSEEQFHWLFAKQENGRKGGLARVAKTTKPRKKKDQATASGSQAIAELPQASLLLTPSSSLLPHSSSLSTNSKGGVASDLPSVVRSPSGLFVGRYVKAYQRRFGDKTRPTISGSEQGQLRRYFSDPANTLERACQLIEVFLQMDDSWFATKAYDLTTFFFNQNKIALALDTGKIPGKARGIAELMAEENSHAS